jgi:hypothetical protein
MHAKMTITFSYFMSTLFSYALMLVVMSFNVGLFFASIFGLALGYMIFGYLKKRDSIENKEMSGGERIYNPEGDKCCADVDYD